MNVGNLPPQLQPLFKALAAVMRSREPAIRQRVLRLRADHPQLGPEQLAKLLIRDTRRRLAATAAASGATAIVPGLGTVIALGTATSQTLYALEQETELVLAIAMVYGRELAESDERLLEALVVVGLTGGAVKLRDSLLIAGGQRVTIAAFRRLPEVWLGQAGNRVLTRVLGRFLTQRAVSIVSRAAPVAIGVAAGATFDWVAVTVLGRAATMYYGRAPEQRALPPPALSVELRPVRRREDSRAEGGGPS